MAWTALAIVAYWFWRMGRSRYGRALEAIREDELTARSMGIDVGRHRLAAFTTAGAVAGLYGVLFAYYVRLIAPGDFDFAAAVEGLVTAVVGGSTMFLGPLLGSGFQTMIPEIQRAVGVEAGWIRPFLASLLLLVVILFLPGGLASLIPRRTRMPASQDDDGRTPHLTARRHPAAGETLVALAGLGKEYGGVHAVRDIDLEVRSGEVVGLIGPNGAGKTTLVNMISGLVPPSSGSATVLGVRIGRTPVHKLAAAGVSRTFQHSKLFNRLSALENVLVGGHLVSRPTFLRRLLWLPSARRDERAALEHAARCLRRVGLDERAGNRASSLSYGDQRRLEIARAGLRPVAAHPRRAGGGDEPRRGREALGTDQVPGGGRSDDPVHRAQRRHGPGDLHPGGRPQLRGGHRQWLVAGDRRGPRGHRGLSGHRGRRTGHRIDRRGNAGGPDRGQYRGDGARCRHRCQPERGRHARAPGHNTEECDMSDPVLVVDGLRVSYGRVEAVRGVSFRADQGARVTLVGANGAGKSSVINAVSGMLRPAGGRITFEGRDVTRTPAHKLVGRGLVQVPEGRQILSTLTIEENLQMGAWHTGGTAQQSMDAMYDRFPVLAARRALPAGALSGGEQQMLAIARALAAKPTVMLMDEPSMGLAPKIVDEVFRVIEEIRASGTTVVLVEQNARRALRVADHGYVLQSGEVVHSGPAAQLLADERIVEAYLGVDGNAERRSGPGDRGVV
jgi:ABC-type branched-subunit amino acid transport system ATPase component